MSIKPILYTSGPIENSNDPTTWRMQMFRELHDEFEVIMPDLIPCPFIKTDAEYGVWVKKHFVLPDMADVARCHKFFVYIDHAYSSGTYGELSLASWLNKDIVCYLDNVKLEELPQWIIGCLSDARYVNSVTEAIDYYKEK